MNDWKRMHAPHLNSRCALRQEKYENNIIKIEIERKRNKQTGDYAAKHSLAYEIAATKTIAYKLNSTN